MQTELKSVKEERRSLQEELGAKRHTLQQLEGIGMEYVLLCPGLSVKYSEVNAITIWDIKKKHY